MSDRKHIQSIEGDAKPADIFQACGEALTKPFELFLATRPVLKSPGKDDDRRRAIN
jgi:hypothetical protein